MITVLSFKQANPKFNQEVVTQQLQTKRKLVLMTLRLNLTKLRKIKLLYFIAQSQDIKNNEYRKSHLRTLIN